jgi:hypothetical protein
MKRSFWNEETQKYEGVVLAEDKGAWISAASLAVFAVLSFAGVVYTLFG